MTGEKTILAVDPGSSKCGMALVRRDGSDVLHMEWHGIVQTEALAKRAADLQADHPFGLIVVGNGTRSRSVVEALRDQMPSIGILVVDERETTMEARERYWEHNPRRGWRKLLPATLQLPPVPIDDYAALILAERVLTSE